MTVSTADRLAKIHHEAIEDFDRIYQAQWPEREQCVEDRRFYSIAGAQWEGPLGDQFANKPKFEFNKSHLAVIRVFNEYRANRVDVDFVPRDGAEDELADVCDSLLRADEQASSADEAYDNAYEEGVGGGVGAWRLCAEYEDEEDDEDERQRVRIEPIHDADTCVFFDLDAKRQDKADAKRAYVLTPYTHEAAEEEFGADVTSWTKPQGAVFDWCPPDVVWVCEHYRIEERKEVVRYFAGLDPEADEMIVTEADIEQDPTLLDELSATGFREVRSKKVKRRVVHKYLLSGSGVLEDCGIVAGRHIPIIPFFGKRWVVDGVERCMGHVRIAKDAQRLTNMLMSWLAEMSARFDIEKPIFTPQQVAKHATMWANDNVSKFPYLLADPLVDPQTGGFAATGPIGYTKAPAIPPAMAALSQVAEQALTDLLGNQQAGEEIRPNLSGKAVELIQNRLDMQVFIYMSNFARAKKRAGEVWLSMMSDIAVEKSRRMKTIDASGKAGSVVLNQPAFDKEKGAEYVRNDMSRARLDVVADVGPSSSSKRAATVRALTGMLTITQDPQTQQVLTAMAMMNMEGEGISEVREFFRGRLLRMGAVKPTEEEKQQLASEQQTAQPDPQAVYLMKAADKEEAAAAKARADTVDAIASADLKRAQTAKTLAETDGARQDQVFGAAEAIRQAAMPPQGAPMLGDAQV